MKILKENNYDDWSLEVSCNGLNWNQNDMFPCGSKLELDVNDVLIRSWFKYPDREGSNYGFICPICGCFTEIKDDLLPSGVKRLAKDYLKMKGETNNVD